MNNVVRWVVSVLIIEFHAILDFVDYTTSIHSYFYYEYFKPSQFPNMEDTKKSSGKFLTIIIQTNFNFKSCVFFHLKFYYYYRKWNTFTVLHSFLLAFALFYLKHSCCLTSCLYLTTSFIQVRVQFRDNCSFAFILGWRSTSHIMDRGIDPSAELAMRAKASACWFSDCGTWLMWKWDSFLRSLGSWLDTSACCLIWPHIRLRFDPL